MRVCIVGHSLVDLRQVLFCEELQKQGVDVLEIFPMRWHHQYRPGSFNVDYKKGIAGYTFPKRAYRKIEEFSPDIIYSMTELWQRQAYVSLGWASALAVHIAYFVWENIRSHVPIRGLNLVRNYYHHHYSYYHRASALIIAGNREAAKIHCADAVLPQVGIDTELFCPMDEIRKEFDLVFVGRDTPEKGTETIKEAVRGLDTKILWRKGFLDYNQLPAFFNRAKIHLSPSVDVPFWREQAGNYSNVESLSCGLSVVTSNSAAIVEWLDGCPSVTFVPQNDATALREAIQRIETPGRGREWVKEKYSNEVVAKRLIEIFEGIV